MVAEEEVVEAAGDEVCEHQIREQLVACCLQHDFAIISNFLNIAGRYNHW